jgi:hypothetical protein
METKLLTIIIPVRDEKETIAKTVLHLKQSVHTPHIIFIADDTISEFDHTHDEVVKLQSTYDTIVWIAKKKTDPDGFGPSLCRAIRNVSTPYTVIVMSDSSDDPKTIDSMYTHISTHHSDIVCGSRYGKNAKKIGGPFMQNFLSWILNSGLYLFGFPTHDATNAFKMYNTRFLQKILPAHPSSGVEFSLELSLISYTHHALWKDIPTTWTGRTKGVSKVRLWKRGPKYLKLLFLSIVH